jgi:hypothetical protein
VTRRKMERRETDPIIHPDQVLAKCANGQMDTFGRSFLKELGGIGFVLLIVVVLVLDSCWLKGETPSTPGSREFIGLMLASFLIAQRRNLFEDDYEDEAWSAPPPSSWILAPGSRFPALHQTWAAVRPD